MVNKLTLALVVTVIVQTGCTVSRMQKSNNDSHSRNLPDLYQNYYEYPELIDSPTLSEIERAYAQKQGSPQLNRVNVDPTIWAKNSIRRKDFPKFTVKTVEIPLSLPNELRPKSIKAIQNQISHLPKADHKKGEDLKLTYLNRIELYEPKGLSVGEKRPAIIISPILGGNMIVDGFAKYYAKHGFITAIVHRKEISWNQGEGFEQIEDYLRTSIIRIRQGLDWMLSHENVDKERIGALGISYGAILHSILAALDNRVKYHVLAMPAAPLSDVIIKCGDPAIKKIIPPVLKQFDITINELHNHLQNSIVTDPILMNEGVRPDQMSFYIAIFDRVVGTRKSFQLWRAFGKPHLEILPFGHYGGILALPILKYQTRRIFEKKL